MNTNNQDDDQGSVKFRLSDSMSMSNFVAIVIQTIVIVAATVGVFSNYISKIDQLVEDQEVIRKELQTMRTEVITRNEASVQLSFINAQLQKQDEQIRDLQTQSNKK